MVPLTTYEPAAKAPLVVMRPVGETIRVGAPVVCTKVTVPLLPVVAS